MWHVSRIKRPPLGKRRERDLALIANCGLFDEQWYISRGGSPRKPIADYYLFGYLRNRSCNYLFDECWYLRSNPDVLSSGIHPLVHYILYGEKEGRSPSPLFNVVEYRRQLQKPPQGLLLAHFLKEGSRQGFQPVQYFDSMYYLRWNRDVQRARSDPYFHYLFTGFHEGRRPSDKYNFDAYGARVGLTTSSPSSPLAYYLYNRTPGDSLPSFLESPAGTRNFQGELQEYRASGPGHEKAQFDLIPNVTHKAKIFAFYLPQFHPIPENDKWWGEGFTEWTNVTRGLPRFLGHHQPHLPGALGFYDLRSPDVMGKQVQLAQKAGVEGFCFYYYNFNGKRLLERPVNLFLKQKNWDLSFCLMWANENWTRTWDGLDSEILLKQNYDPASDDLFVRDVVRHFRDPRYLRIDGRPLFFIYRPGVIPEAKARIARWREKFAKEYGETPLFFMAQGFGDNDPRKFDLDGAIEFPPHKHGANLHPVNDTLKVFDSGFAGTYFSYDDLVATSSATEPPDFPMIRTALPGWDNEARRPGKGMGFVDSTPQKYERWLRTLIEYSREYPIEGKENLVFVNAWNEWAEAAHLEPDLYWGHAYLNATKRAVTGYSDPTQLTVICVGHDAHPHGAQLIFLNVVKALVRSFGVRVEVVLLEGGPLEDSYRQLAPTHIVADTPRFTEVVRDIQRRTGAQFAMCNTTVTGHCVEVLKGRGITTISLIHELGTLIKERKLGSRAKSIATHADRVVFPSKYVRRSFESEFGELRETGLVQPQGLYQHLTVREGEAQEFRRRHGIPASAKMVLNLGFADLRKGYDLFVQTASAMTNSSEDYFFVWIGNVESNLSRWLQKDIETLGKRFVQLPFSNAVAPAIAAADVFCLTSREDPFPSVVLEALALGVPVVGFEDAGGFCELLTDPAIGRLVPYANIAGLTSQIRELASANAKRSTQLRKDLVSERFNSNDYAFTLLEALCPQLKRVSVVVPNYNCVAHIDERLDSILAQRYPIYELIILDDASTDASLEAIREKLRSAGRDAKIVINDTNSGSVFHQWELGAKISRGEYLWLAEADDAAAPSFLAELANRLDRDVLFAFCDSVQVDEYGELIANNYQYHYATVDKQLFASSFRMDGKQFVERALAVKNLILNVSSVLFRRPEFQDALSRCRDKMLAMKVAGDWLLYVEALARSDRSVVFLNESLNVHRRHSKSVTSSLAKERHVAEIVAVQEYVAASMPISAELTSMALEYRSELREQFHLEDRANTGPTR